MDWNIVSRRGTKSMMKSKWCTECQLLLEPEDEAYHTSHRVVNVGGGQSRDETIFGLDDIIEYGQASVETMKHDLELAKKINDGINTNKARFKNTLHDRIERIVRDLRVALDDHSMHLLEDVDRKYEKMQSDAQAVIKSSRYKLDTANAFLQKAILTLPDDNGNLDQNEFNDLCSIFTTLEKINSIPKPQLHGVHVNIKFPNTMKVKMHCQELAKKIVGEIEDNKRDKCFIDAQTSSIDVMDIERFNAKNEDS